MKLQVKECKKSFKFVNMWVVKHVVVKKDFFTNEEVSSEKTIFSKVELKPGLVDVVIKSENDKFWIEEVK